MMLLEPLFPVEVQEAPIVEPALIELSEDGRANVMLTNRGTAPLHLEAGDILGTLEEVKTVPPGASPEVRTVSNNYSLCCRLTTEEKGARTCQADM